jgi:hypothetical protein
MTRLRGWPTVLTFRCRPLFSCIYLGFILSALPLAAHSFSLTKASLDLDGNRFALELICDLDALALGAPLDADSAELAAVIAAMDHAERGRLLERLSEFFERRVRLRFDEEVVAFALTFPENQDTVREIAGAPSVLGTRAVLSGTIPEGAAHLSVFASRALPPLHITVSYDGIEMGAPVLVEAGARSEPIPLQNPEPRSFLTTAWRYLQLGFVHILPAGLDHILFVLGLFLFATNWRPLLLQISAFTLAHTLTLAMSTLGVFSLPSRPVEILIALSIVYVAVENIVARELKPHRLGLVFAFGLLHGLGFAGVLGELGLPRDAYLSALLAFNVGVELGQLAVIVIAFAVLGWMRRQEYYRARIVIPLSILIAATGLFWVVERTFF